VSSSPINPYESPAPLDASIVDDGGPSTPLGAIAFQGCATVDEAFQADRILLPWQGTQLLMACVVFGGLALFCLFGAIMSVAEGNSLLGWAIGVALFGSLVGAILRGRAVYRSKASSLARQGYGIYCETSGYVSETEIYSRSDDGETKILWSAFDNYKTSPNVALLYRRNAPGFVIFTRGKFRSEADWQRFLALVAIRLSHQ
jgi:hypothetical protein